MRSPALAIAWEFRGRHRWGLIALAGYLFVVATIRFLILEPGEPVLVDSVRFAALVSVPLPPRNVKYAKIRETAITVNPWIDEPNFACISSTKAKLAHIGNSKRA